MTDPAGQLSYFDPAHVPVGGAFILVTLSLAGVDIQVRPSQVIFDHPEDKAVPHGQSDQAPDPVQGGYDIHVACPTLQMFLGEALTRLAPAEQQPPTTLMLESDEMTTVDGTKLLSPQDAVTALRQALRTQKQTRGREIQMVGEPELTSIQNKRVYLLFFRVAAAPPNRPLRRYGAYINAQTGKLVGKLVPVRL